MALLSGSRRDQRRARTFLSTWCRHLLPPNWVRTQRRTCDWKIWRICQGKCSLPRRRWDLILPSEFLGIGLITRSAASAGPFFQVFEGESGSPICEILHCGAWEAGHIIHRFGQESQMKLQFSRIYLFWRPSFFWGLRWFFQASWIRTPALSRNIQGALPAIFRCSRKLKTEREQIPTTPHTRAIKPRTGRPYEAATRAINQKAGWKKTYPNLVNDGEYGENMGVLTSWGIPSHHGCLNMLSHGLMTWWFGGTPIIGNLHIIGVSVISFCFIVQRWRENLDLSYICVVKYISHDDW